MPTTFYEVRSFFNDRPTGILPTRCDSLEEAIAFIKRVKKFPEPNVFVYRIYHVTEIEY